MLKETETEETIGFLAYFYGSWHFNRREPAPLATRMAKIEGNLNQNLESFLFEKYANWVACSRSWCN